MAATPPLLILSAENRLTAAATPAPSRETSDVAEMTALASSAARAWVGKGERGDAVIEGEGRGVEGCAAVVWSVRCCIHKHDVAL